MPALPSSPPFIHNFIHDAKTIRGSHSRCRGDCRAAPTGFLAVIINNVCVTRFLDQNAWIFIRLLVSRHLYHVSQLSQSSPSNKNCVLRDMNVALQPANYSYRDGYITSASFIKAARATKCCVLRDMNVVVHRSLAPGYLHGRPEVAQTENQPTRFEEKPNYASSAAKNVSSSAQYKRTPWRISSSSIYSSAVWERAESPGPIFTEGMGRRA